MHFEVKGLDKLMKRLNSVNVEETTEKSLNKTMSKVQADAKALTPVDTARLRNSIELDIENKSGLIEAEVSTNVFYAPYVEYGTGQIGAATNNTDKNVSYRLNAWVYCDEDGNFHYTKGQPAQPFMYPAFNGNRQFIKDDLKQSLIKALKEVI